MTEPTAEAREEAAFERIRADLEAGHRWLAPDVDLDRLAPLVRAGFVELQYLRGRVSKITDADVRLLLAFAIARHRDPTPGSSEPAETRGPGGG